MLVLDVGPIGTIYIFVFGIWDLLESLIQVCRMMVPHTNMDHPNLNYHSDCREKLPLEWADQLDLFWNCRPSAGLLGVKKGLKIILSQWAPSCFDMSSYRAMWTHFSPTNLIFGNIILGFSGFGVWDFL